MALSVKVYLHLIPEQQEIRRFSVDEGASSNYDYLLTKIRSVFPGVKNKPLRLFWKDDEGELITFSSHEELVEALGSMKEDIFRVYVKILDSREQSGEQDVTAETEGSSSPQAIHPGVVCDGCDASIVGTRFKCVVCPDYDLCIKCEVKGLHKEHEMLRICTPRACPWSPGPFASPPPPHYGRHGFGPWGRGSGGHFWGSTCRRGRYGGPRRRCNNDTGAKCNRHAEKAAESGQEVPVGPPFLHELGEAFASFLGPMGVEVHTYADNEEDCCRGNCKCKPDETRTEGTCGTSSSQDTDTPASDQEQSSSPTEPMDTNLPTDGYVVVDKDKAKEDIYASATGEPDPLEVAIAQMKAMGFDDDNGWLSQLIQAKEYDIGKVLDAIQFEDKKVKQ